MDRVIPCNPLQSMTMGILLIAPKGMTMTTATTNLLTISIHEDEDPAQGYHSQIRSQAGVNRTYCIYANSLRIGVVPDLPIPPIQRLTPFYRPKPGQETA